MMCWTALRGKEEDRPHEVRCRWADVGDWRVTVRLSSRAHAAGPLAVDQVTDGMRARLGRRADISAAESGLFVYAGSEAAAAEAASVARELLGQFGVPAAVSLDRWNPFTGDWDADLGTPSPALSARAAAERARRIAVDTRKTEVSGVPAWTGQAEFPSRRDAIELRRRLRALGLPAVRRGKSVLLGASNEDVAEKLMWRMEEQGHPAAVRVKRTILVHLSTMPFY
jgi:hypothetical protein